MRQCTKSLGAVDITHIDHALEGINGIICSFQT